MTSITGIVESPPPAHRLLFRGWDDFVNVLGSDGDRVWQRREPERDQAIGPESRHLPCEAHSVAFAELPSHSQYLALGGATTR